MAAPKTQKEYTTKYKASNGWNKYKSIVNGSSEVKHHYFIYPSKYTTDNKDLVSTGALPIRFKNDTNLANEVVSKAGASELYNDPRYYTIDVGGVRKVVADESTQSNGAINYKINQDNNPIRIIRPGNDEIQTQNITIRYLNPPTPPSPGPIVVQEKRLPQPPAAPPIYIRQVEPTPPTPPPIIVRERPPQAPPVIPPSFIEKILPAPPPPPRQVIIEKIPARPQKPQAIIYEKWLPYKDPGERQVIIEKAPPLRPVTPPKNIIIEYERPKAIINKRIIDDGVYNANPDAFMSASLNNEVKYVDKIHELQYEPEESTTRMYVPANYLTSQQIHTLVSNRPKSVPPPTETQEPPLQVSINEPVQTLRPKTAFSKATNRRSGPIVYNSPWTTTYRLSYYNKGFPNGFYN